MLIYNHFMIVSYFKTTDKIIYFFTFLFNLFWVSMPLASNVFYNRQIKSGVFSKRLVQKNIIYMPEVNE